ncbi:hypothetical protein ACEE02_07065 [Clostridium perfringens]
MIDWSLYKGRDTERSKKAYEGFVKLLENEGYRLISEYVKARTKIELQCDKGHKYMVRPNDFKTGYRCPICSGKHSETAKLEFEEMVENEGYKLLGEYKSALTKVEIQCDKGHRYFVKPSDFKTGCRCPICYNNHIETTKLEFIKQVESEGYTVIGDYVNSKTKLELECNKNHRYSVAPNDFKKGNRCPHCNTTSHGERLTRKILEECKLGFEQQKKFDGLTGLGGRALSYDFFVEGYLLIEIQGEQHYKPIDLFGREERFKQQQEHDKRKREFAINNGYKLLEIPYFSTRDLDNLENTLREELNNLLVLEEVS